MRSDSSLGIALLCTVCLSLVAALAGVCRAQAPLWQPAIDQIAADVKAGKVLLDDARQRLLQRIGDGDAELAARLRNPVSPPPEGGYGVVPSVEHEALATQPAQSRVTYSLQELTVRSATALSTAQALASAARMDASTPASLTDRFETLRDDLANVDAHRHYHDYWQRAIASDPAPFSRNNNTLALLRQRDDVLPGTSPATRDGLQARIDERLSRLRPVDGLAIDTDATSRHRLELVVHTDIGEPEFLSAVRDAVETHWNQAPAMRVAGLRIELSIMYRTPQSLYPDGAPAFGSGIDLEAHVARFPVGALVLTTGARATHAWTGRSVLLGPTPVSTRTLAHELGHLLGFNDAYIRGFEDSGDPSFGAVIIERRDLYDDLMGNPASGAVSGAMVRELFEAYAREPYVCPCDAP